MPRYAHSLLAGVNHIILRHPVDLRLQTRDLGQRLNDCLVRMVRRTLAH